ncbi:hypothetical protein D9M68_100600 [compost metagenome]
MQRPKLAKLFLDVFAHGRCHEVGAETDTGQDILTLPGRKGGLKRSSIIVRISPDSVIDRSWAD